MVPAAGDKFNNCSISFYVWGSAPQTFTCEIRGNEGVPTSWFNLRDLSSTLKTTIPGIEAVSRRCNRFPRGRCRATMWGRT
jgi:hypothetical protein